MKRFEMFKSRKTAMKAFYAYCRGKNCRACPYKSAKYPCILSFLYDGKRPRVNSVRVNADLQLIWR